MNDKEGKALIERAEKKVAMCEREFDALKHEKDMILNTIDDDVLN